MFPVLLAVIYAQASVGFPRLVLPDESHGHVDVFAHGSDDLAACFLVVGIYFCGNRIGRVVNLFTEADGVAVVVSARALVGVIRAGADEGVPLDDCQGFSPKKKAPAFGRSFGVSACEISLKLCKRSLCLS